MEKNGETIRILSDLHLGHPACRLDSAEPLRPLLVGADRVVFNGDTWEKSNPNIREEAEKLYRELQALASELNVSAEFVCGNHDHEISEVQYLKLADAQVIVTHGDVLFDNISPWNSAVWKRQAEFDTVLAEYAPPPGSSDLDAKFRCTHRCRQIAERNEHKFTRGKFRILRSVFKLAFPPRTGWEILKCWRDTPRKADHFRNQYCPEMRALIIGHVHRPGVWKRRDGYVLINTGGFMSVGRAHIVELTGGHCHIYKIDESDSAAFRLGKRTTLW